MGAVEAEIGSLRPKETVEAVIGSSRPVKAKEAEIQSLRPYCFGPHLEMDSIFLSGKMQLCL